MLEDKLYFEEFPLQGTANQYRRNSRQPFKGPLRVARLCVLGILIPAVLLSVPLYLRYRVYGHQLYPLAVSDMRMLDSKVSTTWCQRQKVRVNATFNAFLLPTTPRLSPERRSLSMMRELLLEDDAKEYWGFYLLKGSSVTVSTCVRWPGASLIVIRGHKHLHECAYIGDNSSEELDEMMEAIREGKYIDPKNQENIINATKEDGPANQPDLMKRHRTDVQFHSPIHKNTSKKQHTLDHSVDSSEITDPKAMKLLLEALQQKAKTSKSKLNTKSHVHRNSTVAEDERINLTIEKPKNISSSAEALSDILSKLRNLGEKGREVLEKAIKQFNSTKNQNENVHYMKGRHYSKPAVKYDDDIDRLRRRKRELIFSTAMNHNEDDADNDAGIEEGFTADGIADHRGTINETTLNDMSNSEFWSSFSSSEEALLNCAGLILNLPLTPHHKCHPGMHAEESYKDNTITYRVPTNGYYFFVFNSENEVQTNFVRVQFNLDKVIYNISNPVANCTNTSSSCVLDLDFFSSQKLVMELPVNGNSSLWNEEFIVVSECEPRTSIYAACLIMVPVLVVLFAFS